MFALILLTSCVAPALFGQQAKCSDEKVRYEHTPSELASKIRLTPFVARDTFATNLKQQQSIHGTRWLSMNQPDYAKPGPWNTTLYIGDAGKATPSLTLRIVDHGNTLTASWINEKLVYVQVWWGRFASSDIILDVEQRRLIYDEFAQYAELGEPCHRTAKASPKSCLRAITRL